MQNIISLKLIFELQMMNYLFFFSFLDNSKCLHVFDIFVSKNHIRYYYIPPFLKNRLKGS